jgi:CBS domain containing-hemolysin-like protein
VHAKRFAPFAAWVIQGLILIFRPAVAACNWISALLTGRRQTAPRLSRDEVRNIALLALEEGAIDQTEAGVLRNLIALREITVEEVMTPRTVVFTLPADRTAREATEKGPPPFARVPIVEGSLDHPKGLLHRQDLLKALSDGRQEVTLGELARPLHAVPELAKLPAILKQFVQRREHLFLVVDEYGGSVGIVTLEDVIETLLGMEIVDETDSVEDMQKLAKELVAKRRNLPH